MSILYNGMLITTGGCQLHTDSQIIIYLQCFLCQFRGKWPCCTSFFFFHVSCFLLAFTFLFSSIKTLLFAHLSLVLIISCLILKSYYCTFSLEICSAKYMCMKWFSSFHVMALHLFVAVTFKLFEDGQ